MRSKKDRARSIILAYAIAHATVAAIMANTVVGDAPILAVLTGLMVHQLAKLCDQELTTGAIAGIAANLFGEVAGTYLASKFVSWIPFLGNAINASVTFGITQVIGWAAFAMFDEGLSKEEAIAFAEKQKISEQEMKTIISKMPEAERNRYDFLKKRLKNLKSSNKEREHIAAEIADLIDNYC